MTNKMSRAKVILACLALALFGLLIDFLFSGVLKIIWLVVYGPVYLGLATAIHNYALGNRWRSVANFMAAAFLLGAAIGHFAFAEKPEIRVYFMSMVNDSPMEFQSTDFSDSLFVSSEPIKAKLSRNSSVQNIPVAIQVVKNYACIESFKVSSIAGVDVMHDKNAYWVWKPVGGTKAISANYFGKEAENQRLLWCRLRWF